MELNNGIEIQPDLQLGLAEVLAHPLTVDAQKLSNLYDSEFVWDIQLVNNLLGVSPILQLCLHVLSNWHKVLENS